MRPFLSLMSLLLLAMTNLHSQGRLKEYSTKINDTCWRIEFYNPGGPLFRMETYKDKKKKQPNGRFAFYDGDGRADSSGYYINGLREGAWNFFNDKGKAYLTKEYSQGKVVSEKVHEEIPEGLKEAPLKPGEIESAFAGGLKGWQQYLTKNLRYPREAYNVAIQGEVRLMFVVNKDGMVEDLWVFKSVEHSLDEESQRLIADSPRWTPAFQDGHIVKSYKIQPIRYKLQ